VKGGGICAETPPKGGGGMSEVKRFAFLHKAFLIMFIPAFSPSFSIAFLKKNLFRTMYF
jgi:hypothetical protein